MEQYEEVQWIEQVYEKTLEKLSKQCDRIGDMIPYIPHDGHYREDKGVTDVCGWINGFWAGMLWQMYHVTGEEKYKTAAVGIEKKLDRAFEEYDGLHHDVGFMWLLTAVADYRLTGNKKSRSRGMHAANLLAGRYNPGGKFIRAWNPHNGNDCTGWMIIDCMMNIPLLYWAYEETKDPRFLFIAENHADTTMEKLLRPDGSSSHIAVLDPLDGTLLETPGGQGYAPGSSWSRGQAWALYGFALSYVHTKKREYLEMAKREAHYFISNIALSDWIPAVDFRAPEEPARYDTTAATCAACGLLELAAHVGEYEMPLYRRAAIKMLRAVEERFANWNMEEDSIIANGTGSYHGNDNEDNKAPIIYGDYYFTEAVFRLKDADCRLW